MSGDLLLQTTGSASRQISPFPLIAYVPAMMAEDDFAQRFLMGLDHVMGEILRQVDSLPYYLDPALTTRAMLDYLGFWISASLPPDLDDEHARSIVELAAALNVYRGTMYAMNLWSQELFNNTLQFQEHGSVTFSDTSTDPSTWPQAAPATLTVIAPQIAPGSQEIERLASGLRALVPATVVVDLQAGSPASPEPSVLTAPVTNTSAPALEAPPDQESPEEQLRDSTAIATTGATATDGSGDNGSASSSSDTPDDPETSTSP